MPKVCLLLNSKGDNACFSCPLKDCFLYKCGYMSEAEKVLLEIKLHEIKNKKWNGVDKWI